MELITNNPYRQLGLLVGATARQESNHSSKINQYLDAVHEIPIQYIENGFDCLGKIKRTTTSITKSAANITLDADKISAALFWFFKGNEITDEPAFDALKDNDVNSAIEIWTKLTASGEVTARNYSAFQNLSTLLLCKGYGEKTWDTDFFENSIKIKLKFLQSDYVNDFKTIATGKTYNPSKKDLQLVFLNLVYADIVRKGDAGLNHFLRAINSFEFDAKSQFKNNFALNLISKIEKEVEFAKSNRKQNKADGIKIGKEVTRNTAVELIHVKSILGQSNVKFASISDKVAEEILQCGIDYFKHFKNTDFDPSGETMELLMKAYDLATGNIVKQRCEENIEQLQEWVDEKPNRDKLESIEVDLNSLIDLLQTFENRSATIENTKDLINQSKPLLNNIKSVLGNTDEVYLKLSTRAAIIVQHNIIEEVNNAQDNLDMKLAIDRTGTINRLKITLRKAFEVTTLLGTFDMESDFKTNQYNKNRASLMGLCSQVGIVTSNINNVTKTSSTNTQSVSTKPKSWEEENSTLYGLMIFGGFALFIYLLAIFLSAVLDK